MIHPIPNWRASWRMFSVQAAALAVVFGALPVEQQAALLGLIGLGPERLPALMGLAVILGRLVDQPKVQQAAATVTTTDPAGPTP